MGQNAHKCQNVRNIHFLKETKSKQAERWGATQGVYVETVLRTLLILLTMN